jgi:transposase, IS6 family
VLAVAPSALDKLAARRNLCEVGRKWTYLYRAVDKHGDTIDFYLSPTRSANAAKRFPGKALTGRKDGERPEIMNTDKAPT